MHKTIALRLIDRITLRIIGGTLLFAGLYNISPFDFPSDSGSQLLPVLGSHLPVIVWGFCATLAGLSLILSAKAISNTWWLTASVVASFLVRVYASIASTLSAKDVLPPAWLPGLALACILAAYYVVIQLNGPDR